MNKAILISVTIMILMVSNVNAQNSVLLNYNSQHLSDSLMQKNDAKGTSCSPIWHITKQSGTGLLGGVLCTIPTGLLLGGVSKILWNDAMAGYYSGIFVGYSVGNGLGVYYTDKSDGYQPNLFGTLCTSLMGGTVAYLIYRNNGTIVGPKAVLPALIPNIMPIMYSSMFTPKATNEKFNKMSVAFNFNILKVNF